MSPAGLFPIATFRIGRLAMTARVSSAATGSSYRFAGWAAIVSGLIGVIAIGILFVGKSIWFTAQAEHDLELFKAFDFWFQTYNVGISLQCLLMIPAVFALHSLARQRFPGIGRANLVLGVVSLSLVVICPCSVSRRVWRTIFTGFPWARWGFGS